MIIPTQSWVQGPVTAGLHEAERLNTRVADVRSKVDTKFTGNRTSPRWLPGISEVPSESPLEDVNEAFLIIATEPSPRPTSRYTVEHSWS